MHSAAPAEHQWLVGFLYRFLQGFCEARKWGGALTGPAPMRVLPDVVREPDLFVLPPEEMPKARGVALDVRPALVIEVISPSTRAIDLEEKSGDYARARIPEYWAVDAERKTVIVHRLVQKESAYNIEAVTGGRLESGSVSGFWLQVNWLCRDPLPPAAACLAEILKP